MVLGQKEVHVQRQERELREKEAKLEQLIEIEKQKARAVWEREHEARKKELEAGQEKVDADRSLLARLTVEVQRKMQTHELKIGKVESLTMELETARGRIQELEGRCKKLQHQVEGEGETRARLWEVEVLKGCLLLKRHFLLAKPNSPISCGPLLIPRRYLAIQSGSWRGCARRNTGERRNVPRSWGGWRVR
ncbi:hypothetical protein M427DRAFT_341726 [Gonapodya prolifera JEL478]|uniref:Uncharacterized protein n=1 Tax=Gonapodya prolifera (strain JEL478) TaxID=1344416 RepID=A0A139ADB6_GONPJ|nr:hypothetical protein M427DRAFT_341726 [Gonapodya prolifera JEL478]|eukprot:KXS14435.1 hypothetical protein M427DRAFT_341726 [Gonapodya prolifera JEL478]